MHYLQVVQYRIKIFRVQPQKARSCMERVWSNNLLIKLYMLQIFLHTAILAAMLTSAIIYCSGTQCR